MPLAYDEIPTPIGTLTIAADEAGLRFVLFPTNRHPPKGAETWRRDSNSTLRETRDQLLQYFAGERREFALPLAPAGTPFQLKAWHALATIPFGCTRSYGEQARAIGEASAVRAVGAANGRNPLPIVLPCHRVIGADGSLTGFGGGLPLKTWLLRHEGALPAQLALGDGGS